MLLPILFTIFAFSQEKEKWINTPAEIKAIYFIDNDTILSLDILSHNPNYKPGENSFFLNANKNLRKIRISSKTSAFKCGLGNDENETTADVEYPINNFINQLKETLDVKEDYTVYYFDIEGDIATCIYEQCLP